jgi:hypothetical protein
MAGDFSNYLEDALINAVFRNTTYTSPATVYVALYTAVTDAEAGTGTEVTGGAYARQSMAFDAPSNGVTQNTSIVTYPTATANWGTVTHAAARDASTAGNALTTVKALTASKVINTGDIFRFPAGQFSVSLD